MDLKFPPLSGGTVSGLNDAGIETFEGDFASNVVRECAQNSLDAAVSQDTPVVLSILRKSLPSSDLPFVPELRKVLRACRTHWTGYPKARTFFDTAIHGVSGDHIDALCISDSNTTGLDGDDDDINGKWFALVKSRGVSNKTGSGSGGAFGIGKDAPLAGSEFRSVIYSTKTLAGEVAIQGVCRLVTHTDPDGKQTQGTGFIGEYDPAGPDFLAVRDAAKIPDIFLRKEPGLDVWILGRRHHDESWEQPYIRSALANFWPAILQNKIKFNIGEETINSSNLGSWMEREKNDAEVNDALPYYQSVADKHALEHSAVLPNAGQCRLHLLIGKPELPRKVCLVRKTGMVIDFYRPHIAFLPFSGLFVCEDARGNELLRSLEPPRHDKWDPARAEEPAARSALTELRTWIRETIKGAVPNADVDQFNETSVPPDLLEKEEDVELPGDAGNEAESDLGGRPKTATPPRAVKVKAKRMRTSSKDKGDGPGGEGDDVENPDKGDGTKTGGRKKSEGDAGGNASTTPAVPQLVARAYTTCPDEETYDLILRADGDYTGNVWIDSIGDDGAADPLPLASAELDGGGQLEIENNKIKDVRLTADSVKRLRVRLKNRGKFALRASLS